jgi:hypothetical protein
MKRNTTSTLPFRWLSLACALLLSFGIGHAQFIVNGDMEAWPPNCPLNTVPDSWTNYSTTAAAPDQAGTCAGTVTSHSGSSHMNLGWINSGLEEGAVQTVSGLTLGTEYRISFWGINNQGLYATPGDVVLEIHKNSLMVFTTPNLVSGGAWTEYIFDFVATAPSEVIGVRVKPGTSGTSGAAGVDDFAVTELVGIRDGMLHKPGVHPNPAQDRVYITQGDYVVGDLQHVPFTVSNLLGQVVLQSEVNFTSQLASFDVSTLRPGVYVLQMMVGEHEVSTKIVKE